MNQLRAGLAIPRQNPALTLAAIAGAVEARGVSAAVGGAAPMP